MTSEFLAHWRRYFGDTPLAGYQLRHCVPDLWMRIHSLPESKRYADTDAERRIILHRQNTVLTRVLGDGGDCWLLISNPLDKSVALPSLALRPLPESWCPDELPLSLARMAWRPGALDAQLLAVADELLDRLMIVSVADVRVIAPYDGGMNLVLETDAVRQQLRGEFRDWLPAGADGL